MGSFTNAGILFLSRKGRGMKETERQEEWGTGEVKPREAASSKVTGITEQDLETYVKRLLQLLGRPDRAFKDHMIRMLLKDPVVALEVYNAINNTDYDNPNDLQITTLENAIYIGMKNDVSFIIDGRLALYEHQSTYNPNMPLRDLFYVACIFSALVYDKNIYGSKKIHLPSPQFVVFYNGIEDLPEKSVMRLSDAYEHVDDPEDVALELKVQVININYGKNASLMEKSPTLAQYAIFVDTVRKYEKDYEHMEAVELAISECIEKGVLADFLRKNKAEVVRMCLFEYDQEKHLRMEREDAYEDGFEDGEQRGMRILNQLTQFLLNDNRMEDLSRSTRDADYREQLLKEYNLI